MAAFEDPSSDPYMSTIRRYAVAVGAVFSYRVVDERDEPESCPEP